jgi:hypothetical protein
MEGKSRYGEKAANTLIGALVSPSQEALVPKVGIDTQQTPVLYKASKASDGDTSNGSPGYIYTARTGGLTSRNRGWLRLGMLKYNKLYKKVKED